MSNMNTDSLSAALVAALGELRNVGKNATNPHFKNRYASLDAILDAARPVLAAHGLALSQEPIYKDGCAGVVTRILHTSGDSRESTLLLPLKDQTAQGVGSALTYARRYAISSILCIAADDDDDGQQASHSKYSVQMPSAPKIPTKDWSGEVTSLMKIDKVSEPEIFAYLKSKDAKVDATTVKTLPIPFLKGLVAKWEEVVAFSFSDIKEAA